MVLLVSSLDSRGRPAGRSFSQSLLTSDCGDPEPPLDEGVLLSAESLPIFLPIGSIAGLLGQSEEYEDGVVEILDEEDLLRLWEIGNGMEDMFDSRQAVANMGALKPTE